MTDQPIDDLPEELTRQVETLVSVLKTTLHNRHPAVQSAVLADLLAMYLAGHAPELRDEVLAMHLDLVRKLVPTNEGIMFGDLGHPGTWDLDRLPELLAKARAEGRHELVRQIERLVAETEAEEGRDEPPAAPGGED